jgi:hypothetical protein
MEKGEMLKARRQKWFIGMRIGKYNIVIRQTPEKLSGFSHAENKR